MKQRPLLAFILALCATVALHAQRTDRLLTDGWRFTHNDDPAQAAPDYDDSRWQQVSVPHDWAIDGPFDKEIDKQVVAIEQNGEAEATEKTGRSGALPWIGVGWYRLQFTTPADAERAILCFDGAMSEPQVYVNGQLAGEWKYGYAPFNVDITPYLRSDGGENTLAVRLENLPESSRWYPGAGLYRPVRLVTTGRHAIQQWGINVTTLAIDTLLHTALLRIDVATTGCDDTPPAAIALHSVIDDRNTIDQTISLKNDSTATAFLNVGGVTFWTPETPQRYTLSVALQQGSRTLDSLNVQYGIRTVSVSEENGFTLNGKTRKIKGVCLHHDLGMLGAAVNKAALAHQLSLLKEMGCDAIRTAHNHPSQWQMDLCDSLGLMVMAESFDMWVYPKVKNGYCRFYEEWWPKDLTNLVLANQLHPSIVMWSIGNEIPEQGMKGGMEMTRAMQNLLHSLDPSRPVTAGMDRIDNALQTGYAQVLDIPGMNYRTHKYLSAHERLRQGFLLGSETASTVSSRGVYKFPVERRQSYAYEDGQCSGYDVECCSWSNLPEDDWLLQDDCPWVIGEFVWTGFDYLGEPSPYDEYWPSRSSYFGIFDLAALPKDRYWLYRSRWNTLSPTIHLLPHWTWPGREGETTPVYCYTSFPTAELFVNGVSQGRISKQPDADPLDRYRLRWNDVVYQPGELRVVVYDADGQTQGEETLYTAGKPDHLVVEANRKELAADGCDMAFITVKAVDRDGNLCPDADARVSVKVSGAGAFKGICNGDPTSLEPFTQPRMHLFHGQLSIGVIAADQSGDINVSVSAPSMRGASITLQTK